MKRTWTETSVKTHWTLVDDQIRWDHPCTHLLLMLVNIRSVDLSRLIVLLTLDGSSLMQLFINCVGDDVYALLYEQIYMCMWFPNFLSLVYRWSCNFRIDLIHSNLWLSIFFGGSKDCSKDNVQQCIPPWSPYTLTEVRAIYTALYSILCLTLWDCVSL